MLTSGIMIRIGQENDRFARALRDEFQRKRLMVEYARRRKMCGLAAILHVGLAFVLWLMPSIQGACYVFLCVALGFVIIYFKLKRDLKLLNSPAGNNRKGPLAPDAFRATPTAGEGSLE